VQASDTAILGRASIRVGNGKCSGSVIWKGPEYSYALTASHCVGDTDSVIAVEFVNGEKSKARVIAEDRSYDLALLKLWSRDVIDVVQPSASFSPTKDSRFVAVGFTSGVGPKLKTITVQGAAPRMNIADGNEFKVDSGPFAGGDSGGGIYLETPTGFRLVGVMSHGQDDKMIQGSQYNQTVGFLQRHADKIDGCESGICDWLKPNFPIGKTRPDGLVTDDQRALAIDDLLKKVAELNSKIADLEKRPIGAPGSSSLTQPIRVQTVMVEADKTGKVVKEIHGPVRSYDVWREPIVIRFVVSPKKER
jgi:hypothetical protein